MAKYPEYYVLFIYEDVEPSLLGPYYQRKERDKEARRLRREHGADHGIYWENITSEGELRVGSYSGGFFDEEI